MEDYDWGWLVAYFEGEGSFGTYFSHRGDGRKNCMIHAKVNSIDSDVIDRVAKLLGRRVQVLKPYKGNQQQYLCGVYGSAAAELMMKLHPYMGIRQKKRIEDALR